MEFSPVGAGVMTGDGVSGVKEGELPDGVDSSDVEIDSLVEGSVEKGGVPGELAVLQDTENV